MQKTRKNVLLEGSLFGVVSAFFAAFNLYYWTRQRSY
jgi:hypothetical protein